jgi:hypothetical protein
MIRFAVYPGRVLSAHDGDRHFISAPQLIRLYGVDPRECVIFHGDDRDRGKSAEGLIRLSPSRSGDYSLSDD